LKELNRSCILARVASSSSDNHVGEGAKLRVYAFHAAQEVVSKGIDYVRKHLHLVKEAKGSLLFTGCDLVVGVNEAVL
jgi:hypothetical protein